MIIEIKHPMWPNHIFRFTVRNITAFWWLCAAVWHEDYPDKRDACLGRMMERSEHWVAVPRKA